MIAMFYMIFHEECKKVMLDFYELVFNYLKTHSTLRIYFTSVNRSFEIEADCQSFTCTLDRFASHVQDTLQVQES